MNNLALIFFYLIFIADGIAEFKGSRKWYVKSFAILLIAFSAWGLVNIWVRIR